MVRKLAMAIALVLGTSTSPVNALGLGDINSRSALNQNFDADIDLLSVPQGELDSVRVRLASPDAFDRAGVDRPHNLASLKFAPVRRDDGRAVIRVTSESPIREPFLNFLIEVNWPRGRLVREYTVLLDPPTTTRRQPPQISTPVASRPATPVAPPVPAPQAAPAPRVASAAPATASIDEYGPVKATDTLWGIARKVRPAGVSIEQMMMALLDANPQAFIGNNVNRLRKGAILRVPGSDEVLSLSRAQARQAYRQQQDDWMASRADRMQAAESRQADKTPAAESRLEIVTATPDAEGEAGASEHDASGPTVQDLQEKLLVASETAASTRQETDALRSQIDEMADRLLDMQRLIQLKDEQMAALQSRLEELDAARAEDGQAQDAADAETSEAAADPAAVAGEPLQPVDTSGGNDYYGRLIAAGLGQSGPGDTLPAPIPAPPTSVMAAGGAVPAALQPGVALSGETAAAADAVEAPTDAADSTPPATPVEPAPPVATEPVVAAQPEPAPAPPAAAAGPGIGKFIEDNMLLLGGGAGVLALLLALLMLRRNRSEDDDEVGVLAEAGDATLPGTEYPAASNAAVAAEAEPEGDEAESTGDTSFLSEFSPSDINALQDETGEVDPVSEADVYIAYGRYPQAEDLLKQAMAKDPDRLALKHKLLEVYYAMRNNESFLELVRDMVNNGQDAVDEGAWGRVKGMGRELMPDNPIFEGGGDDPRAVDTIRLTGAAAATATAAVAGAAAADDDEDLSLDDLELSALASDLADEQEEDSQLSVDADNDLAFDLGELGDELGLDDDSTPLEGLESLESLDLELPELDSEQLSEDMEQPAAVSRELDPITDPVSIDAPTDSTSVTLSPVTEEKLEPVGGPADEHDLELSAEDLQAQLDELSDLSILDADLSDMVDDSALDLPEPEVEADVPPEPAAEDLDQPISLDEIIDMDLGDETSEEISLDELEALSTEESDEVATKLELAQAYIEMGDKDGARSILEEVSAEGDEAQKAQAGKLLGDLG